MPGIIIEIPQQDSDGNPLHLPKPQELQNT